jgi:hypothetical protein
MEAHGIKELLINMAKREYEEFYKTNGEIIKGRLDSLVKRFETDLKILKAKQFTEYNFLAKQRDDGLQLLVQKYRNRKADIQAKQTCEKFIQENNCIKRYNSKIILTIATSSFKQVKKHYKSFSFSDMEARLKEIGSMIRKKQSVGNVKC